MFSHGILSVSRSCALCTRPSISLTNKFCIEICLSVGLMHYSRDLQTSFFTQTFIKNGSHGTIHTFKNYFATLFSGQRFNICVFLFFLFLIENSVFTWHIVYQWVLCTRPTISLTSKFCIEMCLSMDPCTVYETHKPLFSHKLSLKMGLIVLFTHLKIILLQCFQFLTK